MPANKIQNFVEHLSWDEVSARIASGASAILPIGAGAKEHGLHLPMNADRIQAEAISEQLADRTDALIWPTLTYGYYPAFVEYAGSCSLSAGTFERIIEELTCALVGYGCRAVFILDTGISTISPVQRALARVGGAKHLHLKIHAGARYRKARGQISEQDYGSHADELETSLMLVLAPEFVDAARAEASPQTARNVQGMLSPSDPLAQNYSRSGSFGDPTIATREKGAILLAAIVEDLFEQVGSFLDKTPQATSRKPVS
ncbi:MAG: creatininase family protein [Pseudomonadota bacterium]